MSRISSEVFFCMLHSENFVCLLAKRHMERDRDRERKKQIKRERERNDARMRAHLGKIYEHRINLAYI